MKRWLKILLGAVLALVLIVALAVVWLTNTTSGARFALGRAIGAMDGKLAIASAEGTLAGPLTLTGVQWRDAGVDAKVGRVTVDVALMAALGKVVHIQNLDIADVTVATTTQPPQPQPGAAEVSLTPPIAIVLDRLHLAKASVTTDGAPVFALDTLDLGAAWTNDGIKVDQLKLRAPDGEVDLDATLTSLTGYAGGAKGTFRWKAGDATYGGTLGLVSDGGKANLNVTLAQPMATTVEATLQQNANYAWTLAVDAQAFDPKALSKDAGLASLALSLKGSGDKGAGTLNGSIDVNGHRVQIEPLRYALADKILKIEALSLRTPEAAGKLDANGTVDLGAEKPTAALNLAWDGVEIPPDLAGQAIATHGAITFNGGAEKFAAKGKLSAGPPGQLADIELDLDGTADAIALHRLALVQPKGGFEANGTVTLKPVVGWKLDAKADRFDPGAFAAQWPGSLSFTLATEGTSGDQGVAAKLKLDKLDGKLRDRPIAGTADLSSAPGFVVDGTAALASGQSTLAVRGRGGNDTNATVGFTVASLGDVLPDAQGRVRGEFTIRGKWPSLAVAGRLDGQTLGVGENRIASLELNADVADTNAPRGTFDLLATGVTAGSLSFERISLDGKGDRDSHEVRFAANGTPLNAGAVLRGRADGANWSGTLAELTLAVKDQPEWKLEQPAALALKDGAATVGDICLTANGPRLCFSANQGADGAANARYRIEHLPLAMIAALAAPDAPFTLTGEIQGQGDIKRGADGALNGTAQIGSNKGRVAYPDTEAGKPLLDYTDFAIDATLSPAAQQVLIRAVLSDGGSINGQIGVNGAEQALSGQIALALNSLSFVELFTPELGAVKGKVNGNLSFAGTVAAPQIGGNVAVSEFATEVPAAGLKLHDGSVRVDLLEGQRFAITGSLASGDGKLDVRGSGGMAADAPLSIAIEGKNFLAADVPAAKVLIGPKLTIERTAEKLVVGGEVDVPYANVDLTKLPGGGAAKTSPDVVVTDTEQVESAAALPLTADITLRLGDDVRLKGFGLDGKLDGQLVIVERPGKQTTGRGEIRVGGTYKAYGQDLKVRTGRLLFAGTAIDNPGLDIQAVRVLKDVTAGLRVQGTAQVPVLTVFSEPSMEQSEALSYLVTGRPLSALKSGDGDMVGAAAQALGSATGDLLAKSVGARLGVDAAVSDNAALGGSAFTVGKYLSPKLYLSYGVGIFTPGEVITLRYKLSKRWELEAQNATTENRAGLNYRWEK